MTPNEFVIKVVGSYNAGKGIFKNKINAEELIPASLNDLHKALYIFYVLQLDYAVRSQILYKGAKQLVEIEHEFFTPGFLNKLSDQKLTTYLQKYLHPRYINEAIKRYRLNTNTLVAKYRGDPRNIFLNTDKGQEVINRLKQFRGFGPKIGNFFVRTMINTFKYSFTDVDEILPPVDVHDVRIAYLLAFTDSSEMSARNISFVKNLWNRACKETGQSWLIFDKALWLLGSEGKPKNKEDIISLLG